MRELIVGTLRCGHYHSVRQIREIVGGRRRTVTLELYRLTESGVLNEGEYGGRKWYQLREDRR